MEKKNYTNNWSMINLKDYILTIESGKRPKGGAVSEGIPSLGGEHIDSSGGFKIEIDKLKYVPRDFYENMKSGIIKKGDILVVKDGATTGKVAYVNEEFSLTEACINEHVFLIRTNQQLDSKYLSYYLRSSLGQRNIMNDFRGATVGGISKDFINFDMLLPVLEIQKKIVKILEKAEKALEKRKEAIKLLDELVKSKFIEMFGDPINNPMGWEVRKLKNISTKILSGTTPKGGNQVYVEQGIIFLRSQNVWKNRLVLDDVAYIDKETHNSMAKSSLKNRDILMTKTGRINTENSSLGRAAMFLGEDDSANINGHVYLIRLQKNIINEFVLFILTTDEYREYIRSICVGGIDKRQINKEHLDEFPIIFPPLELQNQFADFVKQVDKLKFKMESSLKELEDNFSSLMQKAFNGELFN